MENLTDTVSRLRLEIEAMLREYPELADDEVARFDTLDGATDVRDVLVKLTDMLNETAMLERGIQARIEELNTREERFASRTHFIRALMFKLMDSAQIKKLVLPEATLSLRNNPPRLIGDADPATMPDSLVHIKRSVDRTKVRKAIEEGCEVPGFTISNAAPSLMVKVK